MKARPGLLVPDPIILLFDMEIEQPPVLDYSMVSLITEALTMAKVSWYYREAVRTATNPHNGAVLSRLPRSWGPVGL